jgi:hypothetical protein
MVPLADFDLTGAAEAAGFILALLVELGMIVWFARGLKAQIDALRMEFELREKQADKRLNALESNRTEMEIKLADIDKKLAVAVAILQRMDAMTHPHSHPQSDN